MKKSIWTEQRDDFFVKRFNELFSEWKQKGGKNTQGEFARQICEIRHEKTGEKCPVTNSYVSEWSRGKWFPDQYISEIAEVLGVKEEVFFFQTHDDFYKYSSEYMTKIGHGEFSQFCDEIGLDLRFLYVIRSLMGSSFDELFPLWTPIAPKKSRDISNDDGIYSHMGTECLSTSAKMDDDVNIFQCVVHDEEAETEEGRTITLGRADLRFIKDIQDEVINLIEFCFMKREKDLQKESEEASRRSSPVLPDGGRVVRLLKAEELNQIDRYFKEYVDKKPGTNSQKGGK